MRITKNFEMPSIPLVVSRILQLLNDDSVSARDLENVILHDPALSLRILKIANSAFYSFQSEVKIISHAIALLGMNLVKSLAIGVGIFESFTKGILSEGMQINRLWMHSFGVGLITQAIWVPRTNPKEGEFAFLCGLLHDIGKAVLFKNDSSNYSKIFIRQGKESPAVLCSIETEKYGLDHAALGSLLTTQWGLPPDLGIAVQKHHQAPDSGSTLVMAVAIADCLSRGAGIGYPDGIEVAPEAAALQGLISMTDEELDRLQAFAVTRRAEVEGFFRSGWWRG